MVRYNELAVKHAINCMIEAANRQRSIRSGSSEGDLP